MKTNYFKLSSLLLLSLLVACGKPAKESDPVPGVLKQNSAASEEKKKTEDELKKRIESNDSTGLGNFVNQNSIDIKETKVGEDTPLILAIKSNSTEVIDYLLNKGANPEETNSKGETPLMVAVAKNYLGIVTKLLQKKVSINKKNNEGDAALHIAIKNGFEDVAFELVRHNANIRITDRNNISPDELADEMGLKKLYDALVSMLQVKIGVPDLNTFRKIIVNGDVKTLGMVLANDVEVAKTYEFINPIGLLIELGPKQENDAQQMIYLLLSNKKPVSPNGPETALYSPLVQAAIHKKNVLVELLLQFKADPNRVDKEGQTALIHAVGNNDVEMVEALLDKKAKIKYKTFRESDKKNVTIDACDVTRSVGKKLIDPKKVKNDANKAKEAQEAKDANKAIKEKLDCDFWDWLF